jgi:hypothetical protein
LLEVLLTGDTRKANSYRNHIQAMAFATTCAEINRHLEIVHIVPGYTARFAV